MSTENVNLPMQKYIESMKLYIKAFLMGEKISNKISFLKDDVDYFWNLLTPDEKQLANEVIDEYSKQFKFDDLNQIILDEIE